MLYLEPKIFSMIIFPMPPCRGRICETAYSFRNRGRESSQRGAENLGVISGILSGLEVLWFVEGYPRSAFFMRSARGSSSDGVLRISTEGQDRFLVNRSNSRESGTDVAVNLNMA